MIVACDFSSAMIEMWKERLKESDFVAIAGNKLLTETPQDLISSLDGSVVDLDGLVAS